MLICIMDKNVNTFVIMFKLFDIGTNLKTDYFLECIT